MNSPGLDLKNVATSRCVAIISTMLANDVLDRHKWQLERPRNKAKVRIMSVTMVDLDESFDDEQPASTLTQFLERVASLISSSGSRTDDIYQDLVYFVKRTNNTISDLRENIERAHYTIDRQREELWSDSERENQPYYADEGMR